MLMFTLTISCLITSNLPWFINLTFQVPLQYCSLQYWTFTFTTRHIHNWVSFPIWFCLFIPSRAISLLFSSSILDTTNLGGSTFNVISFAFSYCSWGSQGKNTEVVCLSLLQGTMFFQKFPPWPVFLGWPYTAWLIVSLSYTKLWSMWSFWLVFCDCASHSVCPLMDEDKRFG